MKQHNIFSTFTSDIPASLVVFLVALPLCLGIALGSNAPLFSGIIAGIVGGIVVGYFSGSQLSVSGPAAGLTVIVASAIVKINNYEAFLLAVVLAGMLQIILGMVKAGVIGDYIPATVIKGMLAAIGIILILKQLPHIVGYDKDFLGDEEFIQNDGENTFSELLKMTGAFTMGATIIGALSMAVQLIWERPFFKQNTITKYIPSALVVVVTGILINLLFQQVYPAFALSKEHLVSIAVSSAPREFFSFFYWPDFGAISNVQVWITAATIAIIASLESLLSIEATDKLDPYKRVTPANRELKAQGFGNIVSGLIGGLPVTAVIVRSSANISAGAKGKLSAILHGVILLLCVAFIPGLLNTIPLASLAAILLFVGYKLTSIKVVKEVAAKGFTQLIPFIITIVAILFTDLLVGIMIGIASSLYFIIKSNYSTGIILVQDEEKYLVRLRKDVSFLSKPKIKAMLDAIPENSNVLIDATRADFIDLDVIEVVNDYIHCAKSRKIQIEIKTTESKPVSPFIEPSSIAI
jgi:MFS superfamily sulfate permease-like transporter